MKRGKKSTIEIQGSSITVLSQNQQDIICLTDIAKFKNPDHPDVVIRSWLRSRNTVEFLGLWERLNNPGFNRVEFDGIKMQTGLNSFVLTPKQWIEKTFGLNYYREMLTVRAGETDHAFKRITEQRGFKARLCAVLSGGLPDHATLLKLDRALTRINFEQFIIFATHTRGSRRSRWI